MNIQVVLQKYHNMVQCEPMFLNMVYTATSNQADANTDLRVDFVRKIMRPKYWLCCIMDVSHIVSEYRKFIFYRGQIVV